MQDQADNEMVRHQEVMHSISPSDANLIFIQRIKNVQIFWVL